MQGETILCIADRRWHSLWRSTQQYMSRMAVQNRVLFFEPGRDPDRPALYELARNLPYFSSLRAQKVQENLTVIPTPSSLPYARRHLPRSMLQITTPVVAKINAQTLSRQVRRATKVLGTEPAILWLYAPRYDLVGQFGEKLACYFVYDEYPDFVGNRRIKEVLREFDRRMTVEADVVFASSRAQWERRRQLNPDTYFVPNGVDFALFNRALDPDTCVPADVAVLKKPIIGYVGWLGYQIDVDLLLCVAETYSNASLVLVGPDDIPDNDGLTRLRAMPNVHFMGRQDRENLPGFLKAFDVALIPYRLAGYTLSAYPLKLHEYLAAGRAVVSVGLPELQSYGHVIRIADTQEAFIGQIRESLDDHAPAAIEARVAIARENTWDRRLAEIYRVLQHQLEIRASGDGAQVRRMASAQVREAYDAHE